MQWQLFPSKQNVYESIGKLRWLIGLKGYFHRVKSKDGFLEWKVNSRKAPTKLKESIIHNKKTFILLTCK